MHVCMYGTNHMQCLTKHVAINILLEKSCMLRFIATIIFYELNSFLHVLSRPMGVSV